MLFDEVKVELSFNIFTFIKSINQNFVRKI